MTELNVSPLVQNLRSLARRNEIDVVLACNRAKFLGGNVDAALDLALECYERDPSQRLLQLIGEYQVNLGQRVIADCVFRACYQRYGALHVTNLIYSEMPATTALIDHDTKLLYVPIPKCGSSSVKNYITFAKHGKTYGELVHFHHSDLYEIVTPEDLAVRYADYRKFTIVRDPINRLISYYMSNLINRALKREAHGQASFLGLTTMPGPRQFARDFHTYRQLFIDFRHHTDPISGYIGHFAEHLDHVYQMKDLDEIRAWLSDLYGKAIPDERAMVSKSDDDMKSLCEAEFEQFRSWYGKDQRYFE